MASRAAFTPPNRHNARAWHSVFLLALRRWGVVNFACERAGISKVTAYAHRAKDQAFAARWEEALDDAVDRVELALMQAAVGGRKAPPDVAAAKFILARRRRAMYGEAPPQPVIVIQVAGGTRQVASAQELRALPDADLEALAQEELSVELTDYRLLESGSSSNESSNTDETSQNSPENDQNS